METKINIAEILKDKPKGTKLYSPIFGKVTYVTICLGNIKVSCPELYERCEHYFHNDGRFYSVGEPLLFPSKEMRDWHKFSWKKGDVLQHSEYPLTVIFESFEDDTYTSFRCKYNFNFESASKWLVSNSQCSTKHFNKVSEEEAKEFIKKVELNYNGKLNMETLEIEKTQPEFKDGGVITIMPHIGDKLIYLFKAEDDEKYYGRAFLDGDIVIVNDNGYVQKDFCTARLSTEEEKQQLFDGLAKKNKAWDAEKKQIVDIKKEHQFKPFEKVLVRDSYYDIWRACLFSHIKEDDGRYVTTCLTWKFCIPYEGNESLLGTTKDVEG